MMGKTMVDKFLESLNRLTGQPRDKFFLLAVSGGPDSMALAHLFLVTGLKIAVAHCNFGLRGSESDKEEQFVREWMESHEVPIYVEKFNTTSYAKERGLSIQMAARDLRYQWFEKLSNEVGADFIVTAHHLDDSRETFLINLLRGTGITGLTGVPAVTGNIIRPLLDFTRSQIENYLLQNNIRFVTDSSNLHTDYLRNFIRHEIIPLMHKAWPGWESSFPDTLIRLKFASRIFNEKIETERKNRIVRKGKTILIFTQDLSSDANSAVLLYELLKPMGFNLDQAFAIAGSLLTPPGKIFYSNTYRLTTSRGFLELTGITKEEDFWIEVTENSREVLFNDFKITFSTLDIVSFKGFAHGNQKAYFDFHKLTFPLILRTWRQGDRIQPLGMRGWKKVSDLFIQHKLTQSEKETLPLLCTKDEIIWVAGLRSAERFKVDENTKIIFIAELADYKQFT